MGSIFVGQEGQIEMLLTRVGIALVYAFVLAFMIEWGLAWLFNLKWYKTYLDGKGFKAPIAFVVCLLTAISADYNFFQMGFDAHKYWWLTWALTGMILAGGSKMISQKIGELKKSVDDLK
jgi:hypothetical protein